MPSLTVALGQQPRPSAPSWEGPSTPTWSQGQRCQPLPCPSSRRQLKLAHVDRWQLRARQPSARVFLVAEGQLVVFIKCRLWARLTSCRLMGPTACAEPPLVRRRVLPKGGTSLAQLPRHFLVHPPLGRCRSGTPFLSRWKVFGPVSWFSPPSLFLFMIRVCFLIWVCSRAHAHGSS